jgi:exodeoxyribonuclease-5
LETFLFAGGAESLFLLKGYAGTGKSSLTGALVKAIHEAGGKCVLLAPTGRAAKVFSAYAGQQAFTIHKKIYRRQKFSNEPSAFLPAENIHADTFFIVDEASMIANDGLGSFSFGSGRVLDDLIHYVYSGENCRLILLGDDAQLPPVGQTQSLALSASNLTGYGLSVEEVTLTQIVRQAEASGILHNATLLRDALQRGDFSSFPAFSLQGFTDIRRTSGDEFIEDIAAAYSRDGFEETIIITRSNRRAVIFNNGVRNRILCREEELSAGDLLMIAKNSYFLPPDAEDLGFIANGDILRVRRVRRITELYGFRFADITAYFPDYERELDVKVLLDTLQADAPSLTAEQNTQLSQAILDDYTDLHTRRDKLRRLKTDPFYNALRIKYAYAVTCHKAQGGQWRNVFLEAAPPASGVDESYYRWLYTAFTRATQRLFLLLPHTGGN